ncbi:MAG: hypothetical protein AAGC55_31795, partial [Myxococcota bacterium]
PQRLTRELDVMNELMRDQLAVGDLALRAATGVSNVTVGDWATVYAVDNLLQALWLRLNTAEGALAALGHPEYGSRLYLLIGQLDTPEVRDRARLYVLRALHREPRVAEVLTVDVQSSAQGQGRRLDVAVRVRPIGGEQSFGFGFPIYLEPTL